MRYLILGAFLGLSACSPDSASPTINPGEQLLLLRQNTSPNFSSYCISNSQCALSSQVCDLQLGSCTTTCNPTGANTCGSGNTCNPITATCEPSCTTSNDCVNYTVSGLTNPVCIIQTGSKSGYCAGTCTHRGAASNECPAGYNCNRGYCSPKCTLGCQTAKGQICDQTTNTCSIGCSAGGTECSSISLPQTNNNQITAATTACSIYSATCVPTTSSTCPNNMVAVLEYGTTSLCETSCTSSIDCGTGKCYKAGNTATQICQQSCNSIGSPAGCGNTQQVCWSTTANPTEMACQYIPPPAAGAKCPANSLTYQPTASSYCVPFSCTTPSCGINEVCVGPNTCNCGKNPACSSGFGCLTTGSCAPNCGNNPPCGPTGTCNSGTGTCGCGTNPACTGNQICVSGSCVVTCGGATCGQNETCNTTSNTCQCGTTGASCGSSGSCNAGGTCACGSNPACTGNQVCVSGSCVVTCGGATCGPNETCNTTSNTCQCGTTPSCGVSGICTVSGATATCKCGTGDACTATGSQCINGSCAGIKCGSNTCPANEKCLDATTGTCECGTTKATCPANQTCSSSGKCLCGDVTCGDNETCSSSGKCQCETVTCGAYETCSASQTCQCGTSGSACADGQICSSSGSCTSKSGYDLACSKDGACGPGLCVCPVNQICASGTCTTPLCGSAKCSPGNVCLKGANGKTGCVASQCGDGVRDISTEYCDEGSLNWSASSNSNLCPQGFNPSGGGCSPTQKTDASYPGNGQNGHCSTSCNSVCAVHVDYTKTANDSGVNWTVPVTSMKDAITKLGTPNPPLTCSLSGSIANPIPGTLAPKDAAYTDAPNCPCGYGIWVAQGTAPTTTETVNISSPIAIYGGFFGEHDYSSRGAAAQLSGVHPMGRNYPSGTVLQTNNSPIIEFLPTSLNIVFDGFQLVGGNSTSGSICTGNLQPAGGVTICDGVTANLRNLRFTGNSSSSSGGAIRNFGTLTVTDSAFYNNISQFQGGAISSESGIGTTIVNSVFFGNQALGQTLGELLVCSTGTTCPESGLTCASNGSACTGCSTVVSNGSNSGGSCPAGYQCSGNDCLKILDSQPDCVKNNCSEGYQCISNKCVLQAGGGAVAVRQGSSPTIQSTKFISNYSYSKGGAVFSDNGPTITSSLFAGNWASEAGGGIYLSKSSSPATLSHLTLIDNAAYTQGGGGIYDGGSGTSSSLKNAEFMNNIGLQASGNQWSGNQPGSGTLTNQINSMLDSSTVMKKTTVDMCPVMAYTAIPSSCDGSSSCVTISTGTLTCPPGTGGSNCTFNQSVSPAGSNSCNVSIFRNCTKPLYAQCANTNFYNPPAQQTQSQSLRAKIFKQSLPSTGSRDVYYNYVPGGTQQGAAQSGCGDDTDCSVVNVTSKLPYCNPKTSAGVPVCAECNHDCQCAQQYPDKNVCLDGVCVDCHKVACPLTNECYDPFANNSCGVQTSTGSLTETPNKDCANISTTEWVCSGHQCYQCMSDQDCQKVYSDLPAHCSPAHLCVQCSTKDDCANSTVADTCLDGNCVCEGNGLQACGFSNPTCSPTGCTCGGTTCPLGSNCLAIPGGYACSCNTSSCPAGTVCKQGLYGVSVCEACTGSACPQGFSCGGQTCPAGDLGTQCVTLSSIQFCPCLRDQDCPTGLRCDTSVPSINGGICIPKN